MKVTLAMDDRRVKFLEGAAVGQGAVSLMQVKGVSWEYRAQALHDLIPRYLGNNRGCGNRGGVGLPFGEIVDRNVPI